MKDKEFMLTSSDFPRIITKQSIVVIYDGKHNTIKNDGAGYIKLLDAINDERWDDVPGLLSPELAMEALSDGQLRVEDGQVYLTDEYGNEFTVPSGLNDNIMLHLNASLPLKPLVVFAQNLQKNPSSRSINQLFDWIKNTNLTITDDGCFIAYKGVKADFKDSRSGTFDNSPGSVVEMPRNQVDDDPSRTCSHGLHVASFEYASSFANKTLSVKVNPADVVAVPTDYNRTKMRVCKYLVLDVIERPLTGPVYHDESQDESQDESESESQDEEGCDCGDCELCSACDGYPCEDMRDTRRFCDCDEDSDEDSDDYNDEY